mmetsp:Transcript_110500/g.165382  ORF Transcript_110500/g.165382 Transcript_110500/m.165382 type:complete len:283 (-) Transcript_110500:34-882(-)|eukprot:CAMPEP_0117041702 /NCGR_PEP_ID=MMETSP0472-20121206/29098_1 /TAXON_ID=693140 ORGANISM="Tiarina fusus, Strain LIS" /NCGR_SAMPLE_ID=MMETSP0472 /ASSEMBLY_ACC=CAM_ASM_000603 /LENGTH=282 /DNA_ID=CAMNT_0004752767 /DNA_START=184 /DNA_END=1032 /DNA_ORIENTATION=-
MTSSTWFELPQSKFGIDYRLHRTQEKPKEKRLPRSWKSMIFSKGKRYKSPKQQSPFELMLESLKNVTNRKSQYPTGSAIIYLREIFEPVDHDFQMLVGSSVDAAQLSQDQVDRLRIMILPRRREEVLVEYLNYYGKAHRQARPFKDDFSKNFDGFRRRYSSARDAKEKLDLLFGFSFAIRTYPEWIYQCDDLKGRERMVLALARHWRNLLEKYNPEQLGLDEEFSFPALRYFLSTLKREIESIETACEAPLKFSVERDEILVPLDDASVSTMTMSINSRLSF